MICADLRQIHRMEPPEKSASRPPSIGYATSDSPRAGKTAVAGTFADQFEANLARNLLEANGITCFAEGEALLGAGIYIPGTQKLSLIVAEADLEDAKRLLRSISEKRAARLRDAAAPPCPKCGAPDARRLLSRGAIACICVVCGLMLTGLFQQGLWVGLSLLCAFYLIVTWDRVRWICTQCGKKFNAKPVDVDEDDELGS